MSVKLLFKIKQQGINFFCISNKTYLSFDNWGREHVKLADGREARIGPLIRLLDEDKATLSPDETVLSLPHKEIASFDGPVIRLLGLPEPAPFRLHIEGEGLVTDAYFRFLFSLYRHNGIEVFNYQRVGCQLKVGADQYTLLDPLFSLIDAMGEYNEDPELNRDKRFLFLADLKSLLNQETVVDNYLMGMQITRADAFTLVERPDENGRFSFAPVPVRPALLEGSDPEADRMQPALPRQPQSDFAKQFSSFPAVRSMYAIPGGFYLVLSPMLTRALGVARKALEGSPEERRSFFINPRGYLRERLEGEADEQVIEQLFFESAEYSQRVRGIGLRETVVTPYYQIAKEPWLPPEEIGVRISKKFIPIDPSDIKELIEQVKVAIQKKQNSITYKNQEFPASQSLMTALETLQNKTSKSASTGTKPASPSEKGAGEGRQVLLIGDNLDEVNYETPSRPVRNSLEFDIDKLSSQPLAHQIKGVRWLQEHWVHGSSGALLADDMGLGKTFQVLAFMLWVKTQIQQSTIPAGPLLVVAPTGLLKNWLDEHNMHLDGEGLGNGVFAYGPHLKTLRLEFGIKGNELTGGVSMLDTQRLGNADWVLTTYETLRDYQHSFAKIRWHVGVFDETQRIKNPKALVTDAAKAQNIDFIVALTGTPVENRPADLWCIIDLIYAGRLGSLKNFCDKYEQNNKYTHDNLRQLKDELTVKSNPPLILRRMKEDHLEGLPEKSEHVIDRIMPIEQIDAYNKVINKARGCKHNLGSMLEALHGLRSVSLHPNSRGSETDDEYISCSARLLTTFEILDLIANECEKALVFIESLEMQAILYEIIQRRYSLNSPPLVINGEVPGGKRKERVDEFQKRVGFDVMLLSPRAGGVGLTLTAANHVIHLSRWWNPAIEDQCSDRVYRIGQKRPVHIYYPRSVHPEIAKRSFDLQLHDLLDKKRLLSRTLLAPPAATDDDVTRIFNETVGPDSN